MTDQKPKSNALVIKEFFGLSATEAIAALKTLTDEDKQQLGDGIRNGSLTY